jgi:predicted AAA+ superfamily ATPase
MWGGAYEIPICSMTNPNFTYQFENEYRNLSSISEYRMFHYRDRAKYEVDLVIENAQGQLVGVEVKAAASVNERDLRGCDALPKRRATKCALE